MDLMPLLRFLVFSSILFCTVTSQAQWLWNRPSFGTGILYDIDAASELTYCAVGDQGLAFLTTDGGETWDQQVVAINDKFRSVCFVDEDHGWIAGSVGQVFRTTNGGEDWEAVYIGFGVQLNAIFFVDNDHGWVTNEYGGIYHTADGGVNWELQPAPASGHSLEDIFFLDMQHGWAVGEYGTILHTSDGGGMWELQASGAYNQRYRAVCFIDEQTGWVAGMISDWPIEGGILKTENGGQNWVLKETMPGIFYMSGIDFQDELTGYAGGDAGHIFKTSDGGENWVSLGIDPDFYCHDIVVADNRILLSGGRGYTGLDGADVFLSVDNGVSWENRMVKELDEPIAAVEAIDSLHVFVSTLLSLYRSEDGGGHWDSVINLSPYYLSNPAFVDPEHGWVVGYLWGMHAIVCRTQDGGDSWDTVAILEGCWDFDDLQFRTPEMGWVICDNGAMSVLRTLDGGVSWENCLEAGPDVNITSLFFLDDQLGWVGAYLPGSEEYLFMTSDGGDSWSCDTLTENAPSHPFFIDSDHGWSRSNGNHILFTADGGQTWQESTVTGAVQVTGLGFADIHHGWAISKDYVSQVTELYASVDGGITWQRDFSGSSSTLLDMDFDPQGNGWIVGFSGQILSRSSQSISTDADPFRPEGVYDHIRVFPNPFSRQINIATGGSTGYGGQVSLYNMSGKEVFSEPLDRILKQSGSFNISPEGLKNGVYILVITMNEGTFQRKVVRLD